MTAGSRASWAGMTVAPGRRQSAQSLVEFAVVVGIFLLVLFAAVSAAFHSIQREMAETAAATGVQIAASGSPNALATPDLRGAMGPSSQLLRSVMFATSIRQLPGRSCDSVSSIPQATLEVCTWQITPTQVAETVRGTPAYVFPGLARWLPWSIDITLEMHQVTYQP